MDPEINDETKNLVSWDDYLLENPFEASLEQGRREGRRIGCASGYDEGRRVGCALAAEIGMEVGFILGCCEEIRDSLSFLLGDNNRVKRDKVISNIEVVKKIVKDNFCSSVDQSCLFRNSSSHSAVVQQQSSTTASENYSDDTQKFSAASKDDDSPLFPNDVDVQKVLQNIRSKFKLILIQIKMPNHTFQNVIEWRADGNIDVNKKEHGGILGSKLAKSPNLQEW